MSEINVDEIGEENPTGSTRIEVHTKREDLKDSQV